VSAKINLNSYPSGLKHVGNLKPELSSLALVREPSHNFSLFLLPSICVHFKTMQKEIKRNKIQCCYHIKFCYIVYNQCDSFIYLDLMSNNMIKING
jgi:hypothetical protein